MNTVIENQIFRIILTIITLIYLKSKNLKNIFIVLPLILTILDLIDKFPNKIDSKTFEYQSIDKINDLVSYIIAWYIFDLDSVFLVLCLVRSIGVFEFIRTKNTSSLILFPDVLKEYLVYRYFVPNGFKYFPLVFIGKMGYEYYFHNYKLH
jgi:hypothetical protein